MPRYHCLSALWLLCCVCNVASATDPATRPFNKTTIASLTREADTVLAEPNVSARERIEVVFRAAAACEAVGQDTRAMSYYAAGLRHKPWALDHQMSYALLLQKHGDIGKAQSRAKTIAKYAETIDLTRQARSLLGTPLPEPKAFAGIGKLSSAKPTLVLLPMDNQIDPLLLETMRANLSEVLDIDVICRDGHITMPAPARNERSEFADTLRKRLLQYAETPDAVRAMNKLKLTSKDLKSDDNVYRIFRAILSDAPGPKAEKALEDFDQRLAYFDREGIQWDGGTLVAQIKAATKGISQSHVRYLGVTSRDIFKDDYAYLFGWREGKEAVMSYWRFTAYYTGETPNRKRLTDRTIKQALASAGHIFGVSRCSSPTCPRAYPHSVQEHDAKTLDLCDECRTGFDRAFDKLRQIAEPVTPEEAEISRRACECLARYEKERALDRKEPGFWSKQFQIVCKDAETGQVLLQKGQYPATPPFEPPISVEFTIGKPARKVKTYQVGSESGPWPYMTYHFEGVKPAYMMIGSHGYYEQKLVLTEDTPSPVTVLLERKPGAKPRVWKNPDETR